MRVAVVSSSRNVIGGVETYLRQLLPALADNKQELSFWHEGAVSAEHEMIALPEGAPSWSVAGLGTERALDSLRQWQPDVIYAHGLHSPELETQMQRIAPSVFFAHAYYGSCISGTKTFSFPVMQPCDRRFGWQCLLHYYPRRCGGLNPKTMWHDYRQQEKRLALLHDYDAIIVASEHMAREYEKYGLRERVNVVPYPISEKENVGQTENGHSFKRKWRILFLGRMESLKGGAVLLDALPRVTRLLRVPLHVTFAGAGRFRAEWEQRAAQLASINSQVEFNFTGWLDETQRGAVLQECDLLVLPSLWPEPFGLVGLEAGMFGVPVAAFDVGGISEWLKDGINGVLAPGHPPRAAELAAAIARCLGDQDLYGNLLQGARRQAQQFSMKKHLAGLLPVLTRVSRK
jgi:glycosyltransferase involved in cell wall biosynthesis